MGGLFRSLRAGILLARNTRPRPPGERNPRVLESRRSTAGVDYDLYEPRSHPTRTFVMVYGLTLKGERDPRLVNFSRCFAQSGLRVAVPDLAGLKSYRFDERDLAAIEALVSKLHSQYGGTIGITAFSLGAGLALTAASKPSLSGIVDPLLLFGPYYSLDDLLHTLVGNFNRTPASDDEWDDYIWIRLVLAYRSMDRLHLNHDEREELIALLGDYCLEPSLRRKRSFCDRLLRGRQGIDIASLIPEGRALERLSPLGKLETITSRVLILHDTHDRLIPPGHSGRICEALRSRDGGHAPRLLVTPLLSHVTARSAWRILDVFRILWIIGEIFR
jgi:pimeloyl-ACP methyl ester carboxylesterase